VRLGKTIEVGEEIIFSEYLEQRSNKHRSNWEVVINLKTAHAFGLTISPSLLSWADEVLQPAR
jgi:hypothetical protein